MGGSVTRSPRTDSVGRYELLIELAKGGMAELLLARLHGVGGFAKLVAIKRILPHLAEDKVFVEMFLNEGRIAAQLAHPNVCQVYELGEAEGELFLAMEYLDGVSWAALAKQVPRDASTLRLIAGVIAQACEGLQYAHELRDVQGNATPVIHRDVSPQNLFLTVDGVCKVLDFGVAKMMKDGPRTRTGVLKGKLPYMSPEQIKGEELDARADVFALGVVTWEALTGESLFDRDTDFLIWKAITEDPLPPLAPRGFPEELDAVLSSAIARDRQLRFRSARAFGEALRSVADKVGGALPPSEIAAIVKARCSDVLAARAAEVAHVVTSRRSQPSEPTAADTIEDEAGETVSLRSEPAKLARKVAPPRRNRWPIVAGVLAIVAAAATIVVIAGGGGSPTTTKLAATDETVPDGRNADEPTADRVRASATEKPLEHGERPLQQAADRVDQVDTSTSTPGKGSPTPLPADSVGRSRARAQRAKHVDEVKSTVAPVPRSGTPTPSTSAPVEAPSAGIDPSSARGTFSIDSTPYATIYVDGNRLGDTPLWKLQVAPGKHVVRAVLADGRERSFPLDVAPGADVRAGKLAW